jgi:ABC-2 type transport system ATP-binding protein
LALESPTVVSVCIRHGQSLNRVFEHLSSQGIQVVSLRNKENRLEQLFVDLVQRQRNGEERDHV